MNPIFLAGLHGLIKGLVLGPSRPQEDPGFTNFGAPIMEELLYRAAPMSFAGAALPKGWTAAVFAAHHVLAEGRGGLGAVARFADVLGGGYLYEQAYRSHGLLGAIAAHALHNTLTGFGLGVGAHTVRPSRKRRRR
jgi:membrane protease YdiL (CAAX protease family)